MITRFCQLSLLTICVLGVGCAAQATSTPTEAAHTPTIEATETAAPTETSAPTLTTAPTDTPSSTPEPEPLFVFHGDAPYIERSGGWDQDIAFPMTILEHQGLFYFFRTSVNGITEETGYATSPDLITWTHGTENPLITTEALDREGYMLIPWSITRMADGSLAMYFWSWTRTSSGDSYIGRITAPAPEGPYTLDPRRLLEPTHAETWDRTYIQSPTVIASPDGDGYVMMYQGSPSSTSLAEQGFGWTTSPDGVEWTRHGEAVFKRGEAGAWDGRSIQQPHMVHTPDGYVMVYEGSSATSDSSSYGIATSADGIDWTRHPANPIFTPDDFPSAGFTHVSSLFYHDGTYYLLLELGTANMQSTDIWLATYEGSLLP